MSLRDDLKSEPWLPSILQMYVSRPYFTEQDIQEALTDTISQLSRIPTDGSPGSILPEERRFLTKYQTKRTS